MGKLLDLTKEFLQQESPSKLQELLAHLAFLEEQIRAQEQSVNEIVDQNPEAESQHGLVLEQYFSALESVETSCEALRLSLNEGRHLEIQERAMRVAEHEYELSLAFDGVNTTFNNFGRVSQLSALNELHSMAGDVELGAVPASFLGAAARREERKVELALSSSAEPLKSALQELRRVLKQLADHLDESDVLSEEQLELTSYMNAILVAGESVSVERARTELQERAVGPTGIPNLNLLLDSLGLFLDGQASPDDVLEYLDVLLEMVSRLEEGTSEMLSVSGGAVGEECGRLNEVVQDLETCLLDLEEILFEEDAPVGDFDTLKEQLIDLADEFSEAHEVVQALAEREGKVPCVACGAYNPSERRQCLKCSAILPVDAREKVARLEFVAAQSGIRDSKQSETIGGDNFRRLFQAIDRTLAGQKTARLVQRELQKLMVAVQGLLSIDISKASESDRQVVENYNLDLIGFLEVSKLTLEAVGKGDFEQLELHRSSLWNLMQNLEKMRKSLV